MLGGKIGREISQLFPRKFPICQKKGTKASTIIHSPILMPNQTTNHKVRQSLSKIDLLFNYHIINDVINER